MTTGGVLTPGTLTTRRTAVARGAALVARPISPAVSMALRSSQRCEELIRYEQVGRPTTTVASVSTLGVWRMRRTAE